MGIWYKIKKAFVKTRDVAEDAIDKADDLMEEIGGKAKEKGKELLNKADDLGDKIGDKAKEVSDKAKAKIHDLTKPESKEEEE